MSVVSEFKEFITRGNVVDLAVGVIIGGAFGKIVSSLVGDIIMPPIGVMLGGVDFTSLVIVLKDAVGELPPVTINYGTFIKNCVDFLIVAASIFMLIKVINKFRKKEEAAPEAPAPQPREEILLEEIRDLLKERR
ncbi:MAG: large-conductance mechanosensitive channel protein MscL [Candidatus Kapabacteria bacterium]|jgi:large conductance mechanosensitive channel|nr:large-conductance mechanosensitive channel protein MscL [Candidatus Kapabacteria bacterium]